MDADSTISPDFLETALGLLEDDADLMAVGGLFFGEEGGGLVGQLQRNEFGRYQRIVARRLDRVFVLTGTASVIRGFALSAVAQARGSLIPGPPGKVYDTLALTEDNELTLALKTLGAQMTSPHQCRVTTEVMTRWRDLWRQRLRWHRGALENIGAYGFTRATAMYWTQQLALGYGVVALWSYLLLLVITLLAADSIRWSPFWVSIGLVFLLERLVTVWAVGWRARALAAPVVIELAYAFFLQACFVTSIVQIATGRKAGWNYVARPALQAAIASGARRVRHRAPELGPPDGLVPVPQHLGAFNTLVFVVLSLLQLLPPLRRDARRAWSRRGDAHEPAGDMRNGSVTCVSAGHEPFCCCSPGWTRTNNPPINSRMLCQLSYRGSLVQRGETLASPDTAGEIRAGRRRDGPARAPRWPRHGPPGRRGRRPRRTRRPTGQHPHRRVHGARSPAGRGVRPSVTWRCSTTLAVTRSRTSSSSRPGSVSVAVCTGRSSPQLPTSESRNVSVSRSQLAASTCSQGTRRVSPSRTT